jgi:hypothetical protein
VSGSSIRACCNVDIAELYFQSFCRLITVAIFADFFLFVNKLQCPHVRVFIAVTTNVQLPKYGQCCSAVEFVINGTARV